jgi:hypothetical protein
VSLNSFTPGTTDPSVTGYSGTGCGNSAITATSTWKVATGTSLPADKSYSLQVLCAASPADITDIYGNALSCPAVVNFTTGAQDFSPPIIIDSRMSAKDACSSNFSCSNDAFALTFSKKMNGATLGTVAVQDQDGTTASIQCTATAGAQQASCSWNTAVTTLTVTLTGTLTPDCAGTPCVSTGTTPGLQIPFNITALTGFTDVSGNPVNILGSSDRLVRYR